MNYREARQFYLAALGILAAALVASWLLDATNIVVESKFVILILILFFSSKYRQLHLAKQRFRQFFKCDPEKQSADEKPQLEENIGQMLKLAILERNSVAIQNRRFKTSRIAEMAKLLVMFEM